eukprot:m.280848 g.280848  ORF g.280848 m.280848 type:complete len:188 (-) comp19829_c5_seq9:76-639(-)
MYPLVVPCWHYSLRMERGTKDKSCKSHVVNSRSKLTDNQTARQARHHTERSQDILHTTIFARLTCHGIAANEIVVLDDLDDTSGDGGLEQGVCEMCRREMKVTGHHLIPKSEHSRFVKKGYKASFLKGSENIANICRACHNMVHRLASNKELADTYNTVEKIMECAFILRWVEYIATQTRALANKRS